MKQCEYCGKEISYHELYCSDDCQIKANRFYERSEKFSKPFTVVNTACVFGIPVGLFLMSFLKLLGTVVASGSCIVLGLMLLIFRSDFSSRACLQFSASDFLNNRVSSAHNNFAALYTNS